MQGNRVVGMINDKARWWRGVSLGLHAMVSLIAQLSSAAGMGSLDGAEETMEAKEVVVARGLRGNVVGSGGGGGDVGQCCEVQVWKDRAAASGALHVQPQPLVNAFHVEVVGAW